MNNFYIRNLETAKLELHFDKSTYQALTAEQKQSIKSNFLWSKVGGCWVSRAKWPNLHFAEKCAQSLALENAGTTGERLSFAQQVERQQERAEHRAERYEQHAKNARQRGESLQAPINAMHGDIAFFTQPNINTSAGRAFTRRREKMFAAFERGMDEFNKSEYWRGRAQIAAATAQQAKYQDKGYLQRHIKECQKNLRGLSGTLDKYRQEYLPKAGTDALKHYSNGEIITREEVLAWMDTAEERIEAELDKLGFLQDAMDALGGVAYSKQNIKAGFIVNLPTWGNVQVVSTGTVNFTYRHLSGGAAGMQGKAAYAEITAVVSAQEQPPEQHPFKVGETFTIRQYIHGYDKPPVNVTYTIRKVTPSGVSLSSHYADKPIIRKVKKGYDVRSASKQSWMLSITDRDTFYRDA